MENFVKVCFVVFFISSFLLYIISCFYYPKQVVLSDVSFLPDEEFITITGKLVSVKSYEKQIFLKIIEEQSLDVVGNIDPDVNYSEIIDRKLMIKGKIEEYEGKKQLRMLGFKVLSR